MKFLLTTAAHLLLLGLYPAGVAGQLIDFESTPGGSVPADDDLLGVGYTIGGVTVEFSVDTNGDNVGDALPAFEQMGNQPNSPEAFTGSSGQDTADAGFESQLGDWLLRFADGRKTHTLIVTYTSTNAPVTAASGEIWDIDAHPNFEQWRVEAFDHTTSASTGLLAQIDSPRGIDNDDPAGLDGKPWRFEFRGLNDIRQIRISYIGNQQFAVGLAFNNFSPARAIPEPHTLLLLASSLCSGMIAAGGRRRRFE